jgi:hypothetical protein
MLPVETTNDTAFPHITSVAVGVNGEPLGLCVLRGSFRLVRGLDWILAEKQDLPLVADSYYGEVGKSSLREENDLAPYKPQTDIYVVDPVATSPSGRPEVEWIVSVQIGSAGSRFRVTGERFWSRSAFGWRLSAPLPTNEVPIRYELASGGGTEDETGRHPGNWVGRGAGSRKAWRHADRIEAPRVEAFNDRTREPFRRYEVVGLTPVAQTWKPRSDCVGTCDETWRTSRWPLLPSDFSARFYNCAPRCLQYPGFLQGGESVRILGLGGSGGLSTTLPRPKDVVLRVHRGHRGTETVGFKLDTVRFRDGSSWALDFVWRAAFRHPGRPYSLAVSYVGG